MRPRGRRSGGPDALLLTDHGDRDFAVPRTVVEIDKDYLLPSTQKQPAFTDRNGHRCGGEHAARVRRHVVRSFGIVPVPGIAVGREAADQRLEVLAHRGVGILRYDQRRAGVLDEDVAGAAADPRRRDDALDLAGDFGRPAAARAEGKRLLDNQGRQRLRAAPRRPVPRVRKSDPSAVVR